MGVGWSRAPEEIGSVRIDEVLRKQFGDTINPEFFPRKTPTNVHNAYVEVLAETGIVGVVLFLVFVITAFRRIRLILSDPSLGVARIGVRPIAAAILLGIAVWFNDNAVFGNQPETVFLAVMLECWRPSPRSTAAPRSRCSKKRWVADRRPGSPPACRSCPPTARLAAAAEVLERLVGPAVTDRPVDRP